MDAHQRRALAAVRKDGLLLLHDKRLASVSALVAGAPVAGSWWSHEHGGAIFATSSFLDDHADVMATKLVDGKVTFVARALWPALLAVAESGEPWQKAKLSRAAAELAQRVAKEGEVRSDALAGPKPGVVVGALEERLAVHTRQIHSDSGKHVRVLQTWARWRTASGFDAPILTADEGRVRLEVAAAALGPGARLPWQRFA
jgi:hypothetical protein